MRYYIANQDCIPLHTQPENGYTKSQVIERMRREIDDCAKLFGGISTDYKCGFTILDKNFHECKELYDMI